MNLAAAAFLAAGSDSVTRTRL